MTEDLIQKLMISKKIMEKSDNIKRGEVQNVSEQSIVSRNIQVQDFDIPQPSYNIPQEFMG